MSSQGNAYSSYIEYLEDLADTNWKVAKLLAFLRSSPVNVAPHLKLKDTEEAWIIENGAKGLMSEKFTDSELLETALEQMDDPESMRLVIYNYSNVSTMSRDWISLLGLHYGLSPLFVFDHLAHAASRGQIVGDNGQTLDNCGPQYLYQELPSKRISLEAGCPPWVHASVGLYKLDAIGHSPTVIILLHSTDASDFSSIFDYELPSFTAANARVARQSRVASFLEIYIQAIHDHYQSRNYLFDPSTVLLPLYMTIARLFTQRIARQPTDCCEEYKFLDLSRNAYRLKDIMISKGRLGRARDSRDYDIKCLNETLDYLENPGQLWKETLKPHTSKHAWIDLMSDMRSILAKAERCRDEFEIYIDRSVARFDFESMVRSGQQNARNRYLSILAFIYIPLSFITSFFGMNVQQWGTGKLELSTTIASGFGLLAVTFLVISLVPIGERLAAWYQINLRWMSKYMRLLYRFSFYSPIFSFWLFYFMITHGHSRIWGVCVHLGLYSFFNFGVHDRSSFTEDNFAEMTPFWRRKVRQMCTFVDDPSWQK